MKCLVCLSKVRETQDECPTCGLQLYKSFARYAVCIVGGRLDAITFQNPGIVPSAIDKVVERAQFLRKQGKSVYPAIVTQITGGSLERFRKGGL